MPLDGVYEPSTSKRSRDQVELYESSGGTQGTTMNGMPVVVLTTRGATSGLLRKTSLMRVEHAGEYAVVASLGGAEKNPVWYRNVVAHPEAELRDGLPALCRLPAQDLPDHPGLRAHQGPAPRHGPARRRLTGCALAYRWARRGDRSAVDTP